MYSRRLAAETFEKLFRKKNFSQLATIYYIASGDKGKNVMHVAFASALINSPNCQNFILEADLSQIF